MHVDSGTTQIGSIKFERVVGSLGSDVLSSTFLEDSLTHYASSNENWTVDWERHPTAEDEHHDKHRRPSSALNESIEDISFSRAAAATDE